MVATVSATATGRAAGAQTAKRNSAVAARERRRARRASLPLVTAARLPGGAVAQTTRWCREPLPPTSRCTYRLQLRPHLDFPAAARRSCRTSRARRQSSLPLAVDAGAARLDARLRRRRSDAPLRGPRRRGRVPRALRRRARRDPRHRPQPHGGGRGGEPVLARPAACARSSSTSSGGRGGVRRFFDISDLAGVRVEDPEVLRGDAREGDRARARRGCSTGSASTTRTASRTRRATSSGSARPASSTCGSRRSSSPASSCRDWPVEGTTGYEFANDVTALFVDPDGRGGADRRSTAS